MSSPYPSDLATPSSSDQFSTSPDPSNVIVLATHPDLVYVQQPGLFERLRDKGYHPYYATHELARETHTRLQTLGLKAPFSVLTECRLGSIDTAREKAEAQRIQDAREKREAEERAEAGRRQAQDDEHLENCVRGEVLTLLSPLSHGAVYALVSIVRKNEKRRVLADIASQKASQ